MHTKHQPTARLRTAGARLSRKGRNGVSTYVVRDIIIYASRLGNTKRGVGGRSERSCRKGTSGVNTSGVTASFMLFDGGTFWVLPLSYFYLPKSARAYFFPNLSKFITFAAAPLVLSPFVRNRLAPSPIRDTRASAAGTYRSLMYRELTDE